MLRLAIRNISSGNCKCTSLFTVKQDGVVNKLRGNMFSTQELKNNKVVDLEAIKKEFRVHEGGQVILTKNSETGIAYICLDHPEKKNGLSGNDI
jgi:hypothetical protein